MTDPTVETEPRLDKIAAALSAAQAEFPTVAKSHTAQVKSDKGSYSYTYAGLADVTEAVMPILARHGLSFAALPGGGQLTGMLLHSSGQSLAGSLPISGNTPQALGSSITYARRYLLGCMTGLVTDDDDDGQASDSYAAAKPASRPRPAAKSQPDPETLKSQPAPDKPGLITDDQRRKMWATAKDAKLTDRDELHQFIADSIGHPLASSNDLTVGEAAKVIDALKALARLEATR